MREGVERRKGERAGSGEKAQRYKNAKVPGGAEERRGSTEEGGGGGREEREGSTGGEERKHAEKEEESRVCGRHHACLRERRTAKNGGRRHHSSYKCLRQVQPAVLSSVSNKAQYLPTVSSSNSGTPQMRYSGTSPVLQNLTQIWYKYPWETEVCMVSQQYS
eukprot:3901016-Rhodomonas_salina.1